MIKLTIESPTATELIADLKQIAKDLRPLLPHEPVKIVPARYVVKESDLPPDCEGIPAEVVHDD